MALPGIFSPTEPQATETVASGPAKITANFQTLADVLGLPTNPTSITGAAFSVTPAGVVTISQPGATVAADPTANLGIATKQYVDGKSVAAPNGTAAGVNTYTVTLSPAPASLSAIQNQPIYVKFTSANTGASTLNPNTLGAVSIVKKGSTALASGDIAAGGYYVLIYDGVNFQIEAVDAASLQGTSVSTTAPTTNQVMQYNGTVWIPASLLYIASFTSQTFTTATCGTGADTTVKAITVMMPSSGGPFRAFVQYRAYCHSSGTNNGEVWVSDGTNTFANTTIAGNAIAGAAGNSCLAYSEFSPVTYANGASVTFTLFGRGGTGSIVVGDTSGVKSASSTMGVVVIAGN